MDKKIGTKPPLEKANKVVSDAPFLSLDIPRLALESASIGTWIMDGATRMFLPSNRMKELFGYLPTEEMTFEAAMAQITDKYRPKITTAIQQAINKHEQLHLEFPLTGFRDQKYRWVRVWGGFNDPDERKSYFSGVIMDITEQKQNDLRKSKFIGMVSHELKTPLTALKAYVQMLNNWAKKQKDNFTIGALSKVEKQVKKMTTMINGFLNLSGVESGKIHLIKQHFFINELIKEVIEETVFVTSENNITMTHRTPIKVNADRDKIEQVIINLLSNAAKYSDPGAPIEIRCGFKRNMVQVSITDTGMGIKQEDIVKLFEPHYRVERKETEQISGFGIGLYLSSEIIKCHKGSIWVESEPGKGSTFSFTLPKV